MIINLKNRVTIKVLHTKVFFYWYNQYTKKFINYLFNSLFLEYISKEYELDINDI
jgi:hypothetical protein